MPVDVGVAHAVAALGASGRDPRPLWLESLLESAAVVWNPWQTLCACDTEDSYMSSEFLL